MRAILIEYVIMDSMNEFDELVNRIRQLSVNYTPGVVASELMSEQVIGMLIAPFGAGKTAIMREISKIAGDFGYVQGFTTRPKRESEDMEVYKFWPHSVDGLHKIINGLEQRELVQAAVHPTNGYIYGSDLDSYSKPYNLLDVLTGAIAEFQKLGFKRIVPNYIVCPVEDWLTRLDERAGQIDEQGMLKRWQEAQSSLEWGIEHQAEMYWVSNPDDQLGQACQEVIEHTRGSGARDFSGEIAIAQAMLEETKKHV